MILGRNRVTKAKVPPTPNAPEPLSVEEAQKMVQFEVNGVACRWNINEPLDVVPKEDFSDEEMPEVKPEPPPGRSVDYSCIVVTYPSNFHFFIEPVFQLPEASFKELEDYNICDAPPRPNAYIRFIEKSTEELDGEVR